MKKTYKQICSFIALGLVSLQVNAQLSGVYTINGGQATSYPTGTNFQTFNDFANAINAAGVSGGVTVNVNAAAGPYNEQPLFMAISGTSANNRVIVNGNGATLTFNGTSGQPWTLGLNGADYMTFNNLNVYGTNATYALVCKLSGGANYNEFNNCLFQCNLNQNSSMQCPFSISSSMTSPTAGGSTSGNYNTVNSCTLNNGYYGFVSYGPTSTPFTLGNTIQHSVIQNWYYYGFYNPYNMYFTARNNNVNRAGTTLISSSFYPMYSMYNNGSVYDGNTFEKFFEQSQGSTASMYWIFYYQAITGAARNKWINNIVTDMKHNGTMYWYMYYGAYDILHNTFDWDYPAGNHTGTYYNLYAMGGSGYGPTNIYNNIITMRKPGSGTRYPIYTGGTTSETNIDYNNIVISTGGGSYFGYYSASALTQTAWQNMGADVNGFSVDPQYANQPTDLHPTNPAINNQGNPMGVVLDHDKMPRSGSTPDIGALEFLSANCSGVPQPGSVVTPTYEICPGENVTAILSNFSSDLGITYQWSQSYTSAVGPFTAVPGATLPMHNFSNVQNNTWYQVVVTCTNGNQSASPVGYVQVAGVTTHTAPYYESFETLTSENKLPNCSWYAPELGTGTAFTYTSSNMNNRVPRTGNGFASFYYNPPGTKNFYTNGIWLEAGITYSASVWYTTEYYGYNNWTDLSILLGPNQNATGQMTVATTNGPAISNIYKPLSNTFMVPTSGYYYVNIRATSTTGSSAYYLSWDDLRIEIPCSLNSPTMNISASQSTVCANTPVTLNASGADSYQWSTGDQTSSTIVTPLAPGLQSYQVVGTQALSGCSQTLTQNIYVNPSPQVNVLANPPEVCVGSSANLYAFGAPNFIWSTNGTGNVVSVDPQTTTQYVVQGINEYNCSSQATVNVVVNQLPNISVSGPQGPICVGEVHDLVASGGVSYQFVSPSSFQTSNPAKISPSASTEYTVYGTDQKGCTGSANIVVEVFECTGLSKHSAAGVVRIFPNPTSGVFNVELSSAAQSVEVLDVTGRVVLFANAEGNTVQLNISNLANGVYTVKVKSANAVEMARIIKE